MAIITVILDERCIPIEKINLILDDLKRKKFKLIHDTFNEQKDSHGFLETFEKNKVKVMAEIFKTRLGFDDRFLSQLKNYDRIELLVNRDSNFDAKNKVDIADADAKEEFNRHTVKWLNRFFIKKHIFEDKPLDGYQDVSSLVSRGSIKGDINVEHDAKSPQKKQEKEEFNDVLNSIYLYMHHYLCFSKGKDSVLPKQDIFVFLSPQSPPEGKSKRIETKLREDEAKKSETKAQKLNVYFHRNPKLIPKEFNLKIVSSRSKEVIANTSSTTEIYNFAFKKETTQIFSIPGKGELNSSYMKISEHPIDFVNAVNPVLLIEVNNLYLKIMRTENWSEKDLEFYQNKYHDLSQLFLSLPEDSATVDQDLKKAEELLQDIQTKLNKIEKALYQTSGRLYPTSTTAIEEKLLADLGDTASTSAESGSSGELEGEKLKEMLKKMDKEKSLEDEKQLTLGKMRSASKQSLGDSQEIKLQKRTRLNSKKLTRTEGFRKPPRTTLKPAIAYGGDASCLSYLAWFCFFKPPQEPSNQPSAVRKKESYKRLSVKY